MDWFSNLDLLTVGVMVAATCVLGFTVYFSNPRSITNKLFLAYSLVTAVWGTINYLATLRINQDYTIWMIRSILFFAVYLTLTLYEFYLVFPLEKYSFSKTNKYVVIPLSIVVSIIALTPLVFYGARYVDNEPMPIVDRNYGIVIFIIFTLWFTIAAIYILTRKVFITTNASDKKALRIILFGLILSYSQILIFNLILPAVFLITRYVPLGSLFLFPTVVFTTYAILKHELIKIQSIKALFISFILLLAVLIQVLYSSSMGEMLFRGIFFIISFVPIIILLRTLIFEIHQRKEIQSLASQLEAANRQLKEVDELKTELVSLATHHISNPLTAVKGYVSLIKEGDGDTNENIANLERVTDNLVTITRDFLDINQIDQGKITYTFETCSLKKITDEVIKEIEPIIDCRNILLTYDFNIGENIQISADEQKLKQALRNIFSNSLRFQKTGSMQVAVNEGHNKIIVTITDSAERNSPLMSQKLAKKFAQNGNEEQAKVIAQGLGLYVAREIIAAHQGSFNILPNKDQTGLTFKITLPAC